MDLYRGYKKVEKGERKIKKILGNCRKDGERKDIQAPWTKPGRHRGIYIFSLRYHGRSSLFPNLNPVSIRDNNRLQILWFILREIERSCVVLVSTHGGPPRELALELESRMGWITMKTQQWDTFLEKSLPFVKTKFIDRRLVRGFFTWLSLIKIIWTMEYGCVHYLL